MPIDLTPYGLEVETQLPLEAKLLEKALERQAFYDWDADRYEPLFRNDAENSFDYQGRTHTPSGFTRECVDALCEHLYAPGPNRKWTDDPGDEALQIVHHDNLINAKMQEADRLSTLNAVVAMQIDAGTTGDFEDKPITYRLWGREQFAVWTDPEDCTVPLVCVTKDKHDEQTRYRLWSDTEVWTYMTKKLDGGQTSGGRTAFKINDPKWTGPHDYGCLPFTFCHYRLPVRDFYGTSVGKFLVKGEVTLDRGLNKITNALDKYLDPVCIAEGMPDKWKPIMESGRWIRVPLANPAPDGSAGGWTRGEYARLYYLQAMVDVSGAWQHLANVINQFLEAAHIPKSAIRMEQMGVASGISLMIEQEPLIRRAKNRRQAWVHYESDLAWRTLTCMGGHYGREDLIRSADNGKLELAWPETTLAVTTLDNLQLVEAKVQSGYMSRLMAFQEIFDLSREQALAKVEQIRIDDEDIAKINPQMAELTVPTLVEIARKREQAEQPDSGAPEEELPEETGVNA
jgi:hypothetical protein